eukprot:15335512-Heterocapsa_arctica.AAC.1
MASLAFGMISAAACSLEQIMFRRWRGFPYSLWQVVLEPTTAVAEKILAQPQCLLDPWSRSFLEKFSTPEQLCNAECRSILCITG